MGTNETILKIFQAGLESTRGTDVPATRKVYAVLNAAYDRPLTAVTDTSATYEGRRRPSYGRERVSFSAVDVVTFEDLPWWLQMGVKGGVSGSNDGSGAYTYTFVPSVATDDLKSATFEYGDSGNPYQSTQCMVNQFTLRMDADNDAEPGWMLDLELLGRDRTTTTVTGSITDRSTEVMTARGTKIYIDDAGGTIGTTQLTGALISASFTVNNNIHYKAFAEDTTYVAANKVGRGARTFDAQFTFEFDNDTEFAKYRATAPAQRLIRLERQSAAVIHTTVYKRMRLDMYGYWSSWSEGDRQGNMTCTFGFQGFYDITAAKTFSFACVNALSSLA